jgi:cation diffusion facilitator family transporter
MRTSRNFEYPEELKIEFDKAKRIQWWSLAYLVSAILLMALVLSNSQAMKTAWIEDILSLIPPASFLISAGIYTRPSNNEFPYGFHKVSTIAFLISAVALSALGIVLVADSVMKLIQQEHATINSVMIFGKQVWLGWLMIIVMIYSTVPTMYLGKIKKPLAEHLGEKNLNTDAKMNKANWLTGLATIVGIAGIGIGWWWADSVAAIVISADILLDGFSNLKQSTFDILNQVPTRVEDNKEEPIFKKIKREVEKEQWVKKCDIRFREEGHVYFGEIFIVPEREYRLPERIENLKNKLESMNWRVFDVTIMIVKEL